MHEKDDPMPIHWLDEMEAMPETAMGLHPFAYRALVAIASPLSKLIVESKAVKGPSAVSKATMEQKHGFV